MDLLLEFCGFIRFAHVHVASITKNIKNPATKRLVAGEVTVWIAKIHLHDIKSCDKMQVLGSVWNFVNKQLELPRVWLAIVTPRNKGAIPSSGKKH